MARTTKADTAAELGIKVGEQRGVVAMKRYEMDEAKELLVELGNELEDLLASNRSNDDGNGSD